MMRSGGKISRARRQRPIPEPPVFVDTATPAETVVTVRSARLHSVPSAPLTTEKVRRDDGTLETTFYETAPDGSKGRLVERRITPKPGTAPRPGPTRDLNHARSEYRR